MVGGNKTKRKYETVGLLAHIFILAREVRNESCKSGSQSAPETLSPLTDDNPARSPDKPDIKIRPNDAEILN